MCLRRASLHVDWADNASSSHYRRHVPHTAFLIRGTELLSGLSSHAVSAAVSCPKTWQGFAFVRLSDIARHTPCGRSGVRGARLTSEVAVLHADTMQWGAAPVRGSVLPAPRRCAAAGGSRDKACCPVCAAHYAWLQDLSEPLILVHPSSLPGLRRKTYILHMHDTGFAAFVFSLPQPTTTIMSCRRPYPRSEVITGMCQRRSCSYLGVRARAATCWQTYGRYARLGRAVLLHCSHVTNALVLWYQRLDV